MFQGFDSKLCFKSRHVLRHELQEFYQNKTSHSTKEESKLTARYQQGSTTPKTLFMDFKDCPTLAYLGVRPHGGGCRDLLLDKKAKRGGGGGGKGKKRGKRKIK